MLKLISSYKIYGIKFVHIVIYYYFCARKCRVCKRIKCVIKFILATLFSASQAWITVFVLIIQLKFRVSRWASAQWRF